MGEAALAADAYLLVAPWGYTPTAESWEMSPVWGMTAPNGYASLSQRVATRHITKE